MKNFEMKRFGKVVVRDLHSTYNLYGMSMLILMLLPLIIWLFALAFSIHDTPVVLRYNMIQFGVALTAAISSMKIYNSCNLSGKGNYFAMLPASLGEKFCSMMLYCFILTPLAVYVGSIAVDTLLSLLPFGPYHHNFIWQRGVDYFEFSDMISYGSFRNAIVTFLSLTSTAALFMFTNTIFKKNKFIKTVLWLMLIFFVLVIILVPIMMHVEWKVEWLMWLQEHFGDITEEKMISIMFWGNAIFDLILTALFSFFTYRRLKKMQY